MLALSDSVALLFDGVLDGGECILGRRINQSAGTLCRIGINCCITFAAYPRKSRVYLFSETALDYVTTFATYWVVAVIMFDRALMQLYPWSHPTKYGPKKVAIKVLLVLFVIIYGIGFIYVAGAEFFDKAK